MRYIRLIVLSFLWFVVWTTSTFANNKILIVSSYGSDYQWSNTIAERISQKVKETNPAIELNVEYLSSERFSETQVWAERMTMILNNYEAAPPLAIIFISDEAWMSFLEVKNSKYQRIPLFLAAVKPHSIPIHKYEAMYSNLTLSDLDSTTNVMQAYNATAVLREMNIPEFVNLMRRSVKNISEYTIITDSRFYGVYNRLLIEDYFRRSGSTIPVHYYDARFVKTDSLLHKLPSIPSNAGVLMTSWLSPESGFEHSQAHIYKQMDSALSAPIFITNDIGLHSGNFIGGVFNEAGFWGEKTGDMVVRMLNGTPVSEIPIETYTDEQCHINWEVMVNSDMMRFNFPQDTRFVNQEISILYTYRYGFIAAGVLFALILFSIITVSKKNIKLKRAKNEMQSLLQDLHQSNLKLVETQEMLRLEAKRSEKSNVMKSAFIANMESEIRNPLGLIVGFSELISSTDDPETLHEACTQIIENSQKLTKLIYNILDISLIEAGEVHLSCEEINPDGLCRDMINLFRKTNKSNVSISYASPAQPVTGFKCDAQRVGQILYIFMDNAIKFTQQGSIETGYFETDDNRIEFYVKDSGIGIADDEQEMIFDYFYKCDPYISGAGLGLTVAQELIRILNGEIGVSSVPNEGSRFWIRLNKENNYETTVS